MGAQSNRIGCIGFVRAGAACALAFALANCAGSGALSGKNTDYSPKVVADGEPVPKGGGRFKVGNPYRLNGKTYYPAHDPNYRAEGIASWYGRDFHGRLTANGEVYDMNALSAAHPTIPLPSYARVTNLENGRSIIVRVNDRGPYTKNRVIDLSIGTAKALHFYGKGLAQVRVEYVGRAALAGSDDRVLIATLREGSPAPVPSHVRMAANRTGMLLRADANESNAMPLPTARPYELGTASTRTTPRTVRTETITTARATQHQTPGVPPTQAYAPVPGPAESMGHGSLGLMSGRGLY
jgi:rare lipoprotein A